ncbi:M56 family metallopeptidase [Kribbella sp.]|uniref:M56 family metallopeptidase n=1 Tax=Kribbella sp. TaxID=1871183 RepID=UPI002D294BF5|nr:M56 family metallopeptidase [Kribbella sp.]HZX04437.1 M56 family metallopeptidase [Kribbella sp.]
MTLLVAAAVSLVASAVLGLAAPLAGRRLHPAVAVRAVSLTSIGATLVAGFVLSVLSFDFLAQLAPVAAMGRWSQPLLLHRDTIPSWLGLLACLATAVAVTRGGRRAVVIAADLLSAAATCRAGTRSAGGLRVVDDAHPAAYAVPGIWRGQIVVTTALLTALDRDERRVLLAHEASHLRHRHHLYIALAELSAAANPLVRSTTSFVRAAVERWADEDAATTTGDRRTAARAIARAALATARVPADAVTSRGLAVAQGAVSERVSALLHSPPPPKRWRLAPILAGLAIAAAGAYVVAHTTELRFEQAHHLYLQR